jgi:hypothetical protein
LGLSAQRIHQDLVAQQGFTGSYSRVRRFVRSLEATQELPFRRLECGPGEEAPVDFGTAAPVVSPDGKRRRRYVFRIVLSHSRKAYSEAVYRQTTVTPATRLNGPVMWRSPAAPTGCEPSATCWSGKLRVRSRCRFRRSIRSAVHCRITVNSPITHSQRRLSHE